MSPIPAKNAILLILTMNMKISDIANTFTDAPQLAVQPCDEDELVFRFSMQQNTGGMKLTGGTEVLGGKTCPNATLFATNPTWTGPG
jgi:hypothetical protein